MISSQLEIIEQGKQYLHSISDLQYREIVKPHFTSTPGAHVRHILDHYYALMKQQTGVINYNIRQRFSSLEKSRFDALQAFEKIADWLGTLTTEDLQSKVSVITEISVSEQENFTTESTLERELIFVSSHAVHHYAILKIMASLQGIALDAGLGLAPATATFERNNIAS